MNALRWGLISTARINAKVIPAINTSKRSILAAVASRSLETAVRYAGEWNIPLAFDSYASMVASDEIDAVYVSLPNHLHSEWCIRALQAGKHVLCEKPFAITLPEVDQMISTSRSTGKVIAEAFMYRHHPQTKMVGDWVRSGRLGDILHISGDFHFKLTKPGDIRLDPSKGGGSLWDIGVYPISYTQFLMGSAPQKVMGLQRFSASGVDINFTAQMEYSQGQTAHLTASFDSPYFMAVEIFGTEGRIFIPTPFTGMEKTGYFVYASNQSDPEKISFPRKDLYLGEIEDMESAALDGTAPLISLAETRDQIRTARALLTSAQARRPVELNEIQ